MNTIPIGGDCYVLLDGLYDNLSASYVNDASCSAVLKDSDGDTIKTVTCNYESASNGKYEGTILAADTADLTENAWYTITVTATSGANTYKEIASAQARIHKD